MSKQRGGSSVQALWIALSYLLTNAVFHPLMTALSVTLSHGMILGVAVFFLTLGVTVTASASSVSGVIAGRTITGIGAAGLNTLCVILPQTTFPLRLQHKYILIIEGAYAFGLVFAPLIGALFAQYRTWVSTRILASALEI